MTPVESLCQKLGIPLADRRASEGFAWDGKTLARFQGKYPVPDWILCHDVAHYMLAAPYRRRIPDFGLGSSPDSELSAPLVVTTRFADQEEALAAFLGLLYQRHLGLDFTCTWDHLSFSLFEGNPCLREQEIRLLTALAKRGLISPVPPQLTFEMMQGDLSICRPLFG